MIVNGLSAVLLSAFIVEKHIQHIDAFTPMGAYNLNMIYPRYNVQRSETSLSCQLCPSDENLHENEKVFFQTSPVKAYTARDARITIPSSLLLSTLANTAFTGSVAAADGSFLGALNSNFPNSFANGQIVSQLLPILKKRGYTKTNTLVASSLCSDEINYSDQSLESQLRSNLVPARYGGVFHLGGLAGVPSVGISGFKACLGHVPIDGKVVLVFGPHIGIDENGVVGKIKRIGQDTKPTGTCGAVVGAKKALGVKKDPSAQDEEKFVNDTQEDAIIKYLSKKFKGKKSDEVGITEVTQSMYNLVRDEVLAYLQACILPDSKAFWGGISEIILLGGIVINKSYLQGDDYFQPLMLQALSAKGTKDLLSETYSL